MTDMKQFLTGVSVTYIIIGAINSFYLWAAIGRSDCIAADGMLYVYCNSGIGLSHFVAVIAWPAFWFL